MTSQEIEFVEKITRAKVLLEKLKVNHTESCIIETDPEGYAPCNCGATEENAKIQAVINELQIKPTS